MSKDLVLDVIELNEYYDLADEVVKKILARELKRTQDNANKLVESGIVPDGPYLMDTTSKNILSMTLIVVSSVSKKVVSILQDANNDIAKRYLDKEGSE
jgi:transposase